MISLFRSGLMAVVVTLATLFWGGLVMIGAKLGIGTPGEGIYERVPRIWSRMILWAAGVKVQVHGMERFQTADGGTTGSYIFASNHVSHFDIPALVGALPKHFFVAKSELFKIPVFGPGIRAVGTIPIERTNQKAAFVSYRVAADRIRAGASVVVFPEGTRGTEYNIRPFKKGPFVLAIEAGVPIVPCIVHGTIEVLPRDTLLLHPGRVDVHLLEPVPTAGLTYDDRNSLAETVRERMAAAMQTIYPNV
jgi:1-acyl-sn-glycerol-3-phosphate acyltransferase